MIDGRQERGESGDRRERGGRGEMGERDRRERCFCKNSGGSPEPAEIAFKHHRSLKIAAALLLCVKCREFVPPHNELFLKNSRNCIERRFFAIASMMWWRVNVMCDTVWKNPYKKITKKDNNTIFLTFFVLIITVGWIWIRIIWSRSSPISDGDLDPCKWYVSGGSGSRTLVNSRSRGRFYSGRHIFRARQKFRAIDFTCLFPTLKIKNIIFFLFANIVCLQTES